MGRNLFPYFNLLLTLAFSPIPLPIGSKRVEGAEMETGLEEIWDCKIISNILYDNSIVI
jgi:hypothetical protein